MNSPATDPRLFVALPLPTPVAACFAERITQLRRIAAGPAVRWVRAEQLHLTLVFLGTVAATRVDALCAALREACADGAPFPLQSDTLGFFPLARRPRVLWAGVTCATSQLHDLAARIRDCTLAFGDRPCEPGFHAHITLARIRDPAASTIRTLTAHVQASTAPVCGAWTADVVALVRSELSPGGSRYTCIARFPLGDIPE